MSNQQNEVHFKEPLQLFCNFLKAKSPEHVDVQGFSAFVPWHRLEVSNDSQLPKFSPPNNLNSTVYLHVMCVVSYLEAFYFICFLSPFFNFMVTFINLLKTRYYMILLTYDHNKSNVFKK